MKFLFPLAIGWVGAIVGMEMAPTTFEAWWVGALTAVAIMIFMEVVR